MRSYIVVCITRSLFLIMDGDFIWHLVWEEGCLTSLNLYTSYALDLYIWEIWLIDSLAGHSMLELCTGFLLEVWKEKDGQIHFIGIIVSTLLFSFSFFLLYIFPQIISLNVLLSVSVYLCVIWWLSMIYLLN